MPEEETIKYTLDVIRRALEEDEAPNEALVNDDILMLDQLVKEDGTIASLESINFKKKETSNILDKKINKIFDLHLSKWLDKNIPVYLEKYFKNKEK